MMHSLKNVNFSSYPKIFDESCYRRKRWLFEVKKESLTLVLNRSILIEKKFEELQLGQ